jgi:hypothetical protein
MRIIRDFCTLASGGDPQIGLAPQVELEKACRLCRRNRQGGVAVEFALVAPVLVLMVFGMIEFGRAIMAEPSTAYNGDSVTTTVPIPYNSVTWLPNPQFLGSKTLQVSCVMRRESIR